MNAVFDAKDKSDLGAAYSKNEEGEERINLQILYNDTQTKVLNPSVHEGTLYAGTPFFDNSDDINGFYKKYFTKLYIPPEQRKLFGASSIEDIYAASEKARKAAGMFPKSSDEGYKGPRSDIKYTTSKKEDTLSDLDNLIEKSQSKDSGATGEKPRLGKDVDEDKRGGDGKTRNKFTADTSSFSSQTAAKARANTQKEKEKRGTMGSSGSFGGKGGGAPGY